MASIATKRRPLCATAAMVRRRPTPRAAHASHSIPKVWFGEADDTGNASGFATRGFAGPSAYALLSDNRVSAKPISRTAPNVSVQAQIALDESRLRIILTAAIVTTFVFANGVVLFGVWFIFNTEVAAITGKVCGPESRVVTAQLLMTIVGATTVQLGALTILIGKYVFPANQK